MPAHARAKSVPSPTKAGTIEGTAWARWQTALIFVGLLTITALVYFPAWHGQPIWDDDAHMTQASLRSCKGLLSIWTDPNATQQYYPLMHSVFWFEHQLWGDQTLGYHFVNILLHSTAAFLFFCILRRLLIPGALLAAGIFALHPVHVESVAWISELKNTLSGVCYLGAALAYFQFDEKRNKSFYLLALTLFVFGLLSKTVIATLPAALLLVFWWKRGKLEWKRDVIPTLPLFVIGFASGLFTAWVERRLLGADGLEFKFSLLERCLIAGRAFWFYLGKLFWPAELIFSYPRWQIDQSRAWQYLFPFAVILSLSGAGWIAVRHQRRGLLASLLFFAGTLVPALGFFNVYPFRFSFVADHFQYLASLGIIAAASAAITLVFERVTIGQRFFATGTAAALVFILGLLSWRQAHLYRDVETVWQDTLAKNPTSSLALNNYGLWLSHHGRPEESIPFFEKLLELYPDRIDARLNFGATLLQQNKPEEAMQQFVQARKLNPALPMTHYNMAKAFEREGKPAEAKAEYLQALQLNPSYAEAHFELGLHYMNERTFTEAAAHFTKAIELKPDYSEAHLNLGVVLVQNGQWPEARQHYLQALQIDPTNPNTHNNLADLAVREKRYDEALEQSDEALRLKPDLAQAHFNAGNALYLLGRLDEAIARYEKALQINPNYREAQNNLHAAQTALAAKHLSNSQ